MSLEGRRDSEHDGFEGDERDDPRFAVVPDPRYRPVVDPKSGRGPLEDMLDDFGALGGG